MRMMQSILHRVLKRGVLKMMKRQKIKEKRRRVLRKMKRQKKSENSDRLSDLPDHILVHILEFIDIKHSIQTCVLSKRWKNLWKSRTNITFYHFGDKIDIFTKFVSQVLSGRDNSLPLHKLIFFHDLFFLHRDPKKLGYVDSPKPSLLEVMKYAASHNVQQLDVFFADPHLTEYLELPPSIFDCHSLTFLSLNFWHPDLHDRSKIMFPKSVNLPALKTLELTAVTFTASENVAEPFSHCNMLSTLVIISCCLQDDAQTLCISNSNVSHLRLGGNHVYEGADNIYKVVFFTPKLTSLIIMGPSSFLAPSNFNSPFLEEGNIDYRSFDKPIDDSFLISWLNLLANVKIMILNFLTLLQIYRVLTNNGSMNTRPPSFGRLKILRVKPDSNSKICSKIKVVREMLTYLLQNSPLQVRDDDIINVKASITFRLTV